MFQISSGRHRTCDGITRRQALKIGASGMMGGLSLPLLLQLQSEAALPKAGAGKGGKAKSCIFLFLEGGPSTIDMWDLKPDAPAEVRGPWKPIKTNVPGIEIGEHLPLCAKVADKYAILRSHSHHDNGHSTGYHYVLTGWRAAFADGASQQVPNNVLYPSLGSIVARELGPRSPVPAYINMPGPMQAGGPGFYGPEYAPFVLETDPVQPDFEVRDLRIADDVSRARFERRRKALGQVGAPAKSEGAAAERAKALAKYYERAYDLITAPEARKAFDIGSEPAKVREAYGYTSLGQCALLARRLVEAGCRFVGIDHGSWDTHFSQFPSLEHDLIPHADRAWSALITDLDQRGLLDETLVVMMGEMGRTPQINAQGGRDHWSMAQSVLFAGGGVRGGQVIGATDKTGSEPVTEPYGVEDLLRTIFHQMGIDSTKTYLTPLGRPVPIVNGGRLVEGLIG
jgi:hypothetical protein